MMKICSKCGKEKNIDMFYKHKYGKNGYVAKCKDCMNEERRAIEQNKKDGTYVSRVRKPRLSNEDRERISQERYEYNKQWRESNKESLVTKKRNYMEFIKLEGIAAYGGKCSCCGEVIPEFLTIEHLEGRDKNEKRLTGKKMWAKAKSEGYPDKYTVLCFNCNCAKGAFGICPHQKNVMITAT